VGELFVGREHELSVLTRHLTGLRAGSGCAVLVAGEAGIGKTTVELAHPLRIGRVSARHYAFEVHAAACPGAERDGDIPLTAGDVPHPVPGGGGEPDKVPGVQLDRPELGRIPTRAATSPK